MPQQRGLEPSAAYVVDTNFYIRAFREADYGERFRAWHTEVIARLAMSAVVLHELLVGAAGFLSPRRLSGAGRPMPTVSSGPVAATRRSSRSALSPTIC